MVRYTTPVAKSTAKNKRGGVLKPYRVRVKVRKQHRFRRLLANAVHGGHVAKAVRITRTTRRKNRPTMAAKRSVPRFVPSALVAMVRKVLRLGPKRRPPTLPSEHEEEEEEEEEEEVSSSSSSSSQDDSDSDASFIAPKRSHKRKVPPKVLSIAKDKGKAVAKAPSKGKAPMGGKPRDGGLIRAAETLRAAAEGLRGGGAGGGKSRATTVAGAIAENKGVIAAKRTEEREAIIAAMRSSGSALLSTLKARMATITQLNDLIRSEAVPGSSDDERAAKAPDSRRAGDAQRSLMRRKRLDELREELSVSCQGCVPLLDAGAIHAAMARNIELSHVRPLELETVSRAYEEGFMRETNGKAGERPCFNGEACETYAMACARGWPPFVMREFVSPEQAKKKAQTPVAGECLLCLRLATKLHYVQLMLDGRDARVMIAPHWNLCDRLGEYNPDACLLPPGNRFMGIIQPVVMHDRDFYTFSIDEKTGLQTVHHVDALNFRCMTYDDGKLSGLSPSSLLGRYFGEIGDKLCDVRAVHTRIVSDVAHAKSIIAERAWCACSRKGGGGRCVCPEVGVDAALDVARFAIGVLSRMGAATNDMGPTAVLARVGMAAYLPLTRRYDAGERSVPLDVAAPLVNIDAAEAGWSMPNLRHILLNSEIWSSVSNYKDGTIEAMFAHVFSKALPIRCNFRRTRASAVCASPVDAVEFAKFTTQLLRCSLMGLFRGSTAGTGFDVIREVDALLTKLLATDGGTEWGGGTKRRRKYARANSAGAAAEDAVPTEFLTIVEGVSSGTRRFSYLLFVAMKEFIVTLVEGDPALRKMLSLTFDWSCFEREVRATSDAIRARLFTTPVHTEEEMAGVNSYAEHLTRGHTKHMYTVRRVGYADMITTAMGENALQISYDEAPYHFELFDPCTCLDRMQTVYGVPKKLAKVVEESIRVFIATGVPPEGMQMLGASDMSLAAARSLSMYARDLAASQFFHFHAGSEAMRTQHREALRARYAIVEAVPVAEVDALATYPFCLQCDTWKAPIPNSANVVDAVVCHVMGVQNVRYDAEAREVKCAACFDNGRMFSVPMAGNVCRLGKDVFTLCGLCGAVTSLNVRTMLNGRHACVACLQSVLVAEELHVDRSKTCAYVHCTNVPPTDRCAPAFVVSDDVTASGDMRVISLCKGHRAIGNRAMKESRVLSVVSAFIEKAVLQKRKDTETVKGNIASYAKLTQVRKGTRKSGPTLMREFVDRAKKRAKRAKAK